MKFLDPVRLFFLLLIVMATGSFTWYLFYYQPVSYASHEMLETLISYHDKVSRVGKMLENVEELETTLSDEQEAIEGLRNKILPSGELNTVAGHLSAHAVANQVILVDLNSDLNNFASAASDESIQGMLVQFELRGKYIQIGGFMQDLDELPFYLRPTRVLLSKLKSGSELKAEVDARIYSWND